MAATPSNRRPRLEVCGQFDRLRAGDVLADEPAEEPEVDLGQLAEQPPATGLGEVVPEAEHVFLSGFGKAAADGRFVGRVVRHGGSFPGWVPAR